jgi:non-ribosomal peptide synthetase component F
MAFALVRTLASVKMSTNPRPTVFHGGRRGGLDVSPYRKACNRRDCVPQLVSRAAQQFPKNAALCLAGRFLTYEELDLQSDRLAAHLQSLGVGLESVVAICVSHPFDCALAALAVWKAGGGCLPLDPDWTEDLRNFAIEDANASVAVVRSPLTARARYVVDLDLDEVAISAAAHWCSPVPLHRDNLAYVDYSPRGEDWVGVELTHGNLLNLIFWQRRTLGITPQDRASLFSGLCSDKGLWELWPYLTSGANVTIVPDSFRTSPEQLSDWLRIQNVSISYVPSAIVDAVVSGDWPSEGRLRYMLASGGMLDGRTASGLPFRLISHYGHPECSMVSASRELHPQDRRPLPIGRPIHNTFFYLLNEQFQLVTPGKAGELFIGGAGVARGYHNREALTKRHFLADPFRDAAARMYRTGTFATLAANGEYALVERRAKEPRAVPTPPSSEEHYKAPESSLEVAIACILRELLDVRRIGLTDDFTQIGGRPLIAAQISSRLHDLYGIRLSFKDIHEARTIAKLASIVELAVIEKVVAMSPQEAERMLASIPVR